MESFIKKVETMLEMAKEIPMWGFSPTIIQTQVEALLREVLHLPNLSVTIGKAEWKDAETLFTGFGDRIFSAGFVLSPLEATALLITAQEDLPKFTKWILGQKEKELSFNEGFFLFACAQVFAKSEQLLPGLNAKLAKTKTIEGPAYSIDIALKNGQETLWCRLLLPSAFHADYKLHFTSHPSTDAMEKSSLPLTLALEIGSVDLKFEEWAKVQAGDFIILDTCSYHPKEGSGSALFMLQDTPLFQTKLKEGKIKLVEYATIFEEKPMTDSSETEPSTREMIAATEIPITLHVEVARLTLPLKELVALKPGNVLELDVKPEHKVRLTVQGKVVGQGQLLEVGDVLGVKITDLPK